MKKIIYIFDEDDKYGGPKTGMEMVLGLKKMGIEPVVLTSKKNNVNKICDCNNIENYVTHHHKYTYVKTNSKIKDIIKFVPRFIRYKVGNFIALRTIQKKIDMNKIEFIHTNISAIDLGIKLANKYRLKNIMHIREFWDLDFNMHSYRKNYIGYLNENVFAFIAISNAIRQHWIKKGIDEKKIYTIYNGVNFDDINEKREFNNFSDKIKILMMGSISEGKGQQELVKAVSLLDKNIKKNIQVDIVGSGYAFAEENLKREISYNRLEDIVKFKGYDKDIRKKINNYDIGIICSKAEGFGRVTIEYMHAGVCVIASDTGANPELIEENKNGLLYKKGNCYDLAKKIAFVCQNRSILEKIAREAMKIANSKFSTEIFVNNIMKFYEEILDKKI